MNKNKEEIVSLLMGNQNILKCLKYSDNNKNILKMEDLTDKERIDLRKDTIFKYRKIPADTTIEQKTYISMEYGDIYYMGENSRTGNPYFKVPDFIFYIISHASLDNNAIIGSRVDRIEEELYNIFHNKLTIDDFGRSYIYNSKPLYLPRDFIGRQVIIRFVGKNI